MCVGTHSTSVHRVCARDRPWDHGLDCMYIHHISTSVCIEQQENSLVFKV